MKISERLARLDRLQQTLWFKVAASGLVIALAIAALIVYTVRAAALERDESLQNAPITAPSGEATRPGATDQDRTKAPTAESQANEEIRRQAEETTRVLSNIQQGRYSVASIAIGLGIGTAICLALIWIGAGLTYLGVLAIGSATALPLVLLGSSGWRQFGLFLAFALTLATVFSALMQALRVALSASGPVWSIARNVVAEAVRMKVTVVFIVFLILTMASLPGVLDEGTPLRYRVQSFLQYGTGGAFWIVSLLTVFLSVGSVAFEQRDKIIWQTMTKPVHAWQYLLGKWLGVVGVSAVLLTASGAGVFLFTEHLRNSTALDERAPFIPLNPDIQVTEDRLVLESQILVARQTVRPTIPEPDAVAIQQETRRRFDLAMAEYNADPLQNPLRPDEQKIFMDVVKEQMAAFLSVPPNLDTPHLYEFGGLKAAHDLGKPLTFRYKVNAGSNLPTDLYRITFAIPGWSPYIVAVPLGQTLSMPISSAAITEKQIEGPGGSKGSDWVLPIYIFNGDLARGTVNVESIIFPPDGLEVSFPVSDWRMNYLRAGFILWLKTCFLAMLGVAAATFLSFPVACLTAFGVLWMAEGATFLASALDNYATIQGSEHELLWWRIPIILIAYPISSVFRFYSDLTPIANIVEGRVIQWGTVLSATTTLLILIAALFATGSFIFRRRELATYSGQ